MKPPKNKKREIVTRSNMTFILILLVGMLIIGKAVYIQLREAPALLKMARVQTITRQTIQAERGNIFSHDGRLLATSTPIFDLRIDFRANGFSKEKFNTHVDSMALLFAQILGDKSAAVYQQELITQFSKGSRYYLLKRDVSFTQLNTLRQWEFLKNPHQCGMIAEAKDKRQFPYSGLAQRTLGFVSRNHGHKVGIEGYFDRELRGRNGERLMERITPQVLIPLPDGQITNTIPGKDVYTTLDIEFQDVAQSSLQRALQKHQAGFGCVILMEVATGKIRAMANMGKVSDSTWAEVMNYAAGQASEPGSTFKLATAAALIDDGFAHLKTQIDLENGKKQFYDRLIQDHDPPPAPVMTLEQCFAISSNVAFAKLANQFYAAKPKKFYDRLISFGFGETLPVEVTGPAKPKLNPVKSWSGVSIPYMAHGYGLDVTPLHILSFYNAIAHNGEWVYPSLLEEIREYDRVVSVSHNTHNSRRIVSTETARQLRLMMEKVVTDGTASNLKTDYLAIAGKTGTAKIPTKDKGYNGSIYQASFCGYFPADSPRYTMIVVVNAPSNGVYYGNIVAGTVFREVADKVYALSPDMQRAFPLTAANTRIPLLKRGNTRQVSQLYRFLSTPLNDPSSEWTEVDVQNHRPVLQSLAVSEKQMPDVRGMALKDALRLLESLGLQVKINGRGKIRYQSLQAGTTIQKGQTITIDLG